jgi:DNA-binding NtrC family response regulator
MARVRILVVDDEAAIRFGIREFLVSHGYEVDEAETCQGAEEAFRASPPDVAVVDYMLPDGNALDLLPRLQAVHAEVPVAILTAHGSIDLAVRAIKEGAEQFLTKPVELPTLLVVLERLVEHQRNRQKQLAHKARETRAVIDPFLGSSTAIRQLAEQARRVVATESPILIQGETGSGKGVLAQWLYSNGPRADEAFVDLNCAGLSRELLESELFGHEKGAFTGAVTSKSGLIEVAHRGTVFLDEIGDIDLQVQPKLLKVVEEKRFRRLGSIADRRVDVQLMSATHQDIGQLVHEKRFRSDLYFRISTIPLVVPSLRGRVEDIPLLARHLLAGIGAHLGCGHIELSRDAEAALCAYPWPGNIRELRNVLERAVLLSDRDVLKAKDIRFQMPTAIEADDVSLTLRDLERRHIERVLAAERGNVAQAALRLGVPKSSLYQKIKKFRLVRAS